MGLLDRLISKDQNDVETVECYECKQSYPRKKSKKYIDLLKRSFTVSYSMRSHTDVGLKRNELKMLEKLENLNVYLCKECGNTVAGRLNKALNMRWIFEISSAMLPADYTPEVSPEDVERFRKWITFREFITAEDLLKMEEIRGPMTRKWARTHVAMKNEKEKGTQILRE